MAQNGFDRLIYRWRYLLLGLFSLGMVLLLVGCSPANTGILLALGNGNAPAKIRIGYQVTPNAELLVKAMGTAEKAFPNSTVEWKTFDSGRAVNAAMAANTLDLGLVSSTGAAVGLANSAPYQICFLHGIVGEGEALVVRDRIQSLRDLAGKKVAVPFGSNAHFSFLNAIAELGLDRNSVTILDMSPTDMLTAWNQESIDAGFVGHPVLSKMISAKGSVLLTAKDLFKKGVITADVEIAHRDFIRQYPGALKKYVTLLDEAVKFYRAKPTAAAEAIAPELGLSVKESLKVMKQLDWLTSAEQRQAKYLGSADQPGVFAQVLKTSADLMKKQGAIFTVPDLSVFRSGIYTDALGKK